MSKNDSTGRNYTKRVGELQIQNLKIFSGCSKKYPPLCNPRPETNHSEIDGTPGKLNMKRIKTLKIQ